LGYRSGFDDQDVKSRAHRHRGAILVENMPAAGGRIRVVDADRMIVVGAEGTAAWIPIGRDDQDRVGIIVAEGMLDFRDVAGNRSAGGAMNEHGRRGADPRASHPERATTAQVERDIRRLDAHPAIGANGKLVISSGDKFRIGGVRPNKGAFMAGFGAASGGDAEITAGNVGPTTRNGGPVSKRLVEFATADRHAAGDVGGGTGQIAGTTGDDSRDDQSAIIEAAADDGV